MFYSFADSTLENKLSKVPKDVQGQNITTILWLSNSVPSLTPRGSCSLTLSQNFVASLILLFLLPPCTLVISAVGGGECPMLGNSPSAPAFWDSLTVIFNWSWCNFFPLILHHMFGGNSRAVPIFGAKKNFFLVPGLESIDYDFSDFLSGSEFPPLPLLSPVCSAFCSFPLHSLLTLPKTKIYPILLFRAIQLSAAMTVNLTPEILLHTQKNKKKLVKQSLCSVSSMKHPQKCWNDSFSFFLGQLTFLGMAFSSLGR